MFILCGFKSSDKYRLLYRGSRDGFALNAFHSKCDNKPKTLVIVSTTHGFVFGGYTEAEWDSTANGQWKTDKNSFIFSLVNKEENPIKMNIAKGKEENAIYCSSMFGPTFGDGHDIYIAHNSNSNLASYSKLCHSYVLPSHESDETKRFLLAGSYNFKVEDIEVFQKI